MLFVCLISQAFFSYLEPNNLFNLFSDSSFVPPLVYAMMGTSKDVAVGTIAVGSLLTGSMLSTAVDPNENPKLFLHLAFTATLVAGIFEATLGLLRLVQQHKFWIVLLAIYTNTTILCYDNTTCRSHKGK